jgi:hypothetical protein
MPIQDYNIYTAKGYAGDRYDSAPSVTQSGIVEDALLGYGIAVKPGTKSTNNGSPQGVTSVASPAGGNIWGISMRELNHEAANRPSDGTANYLETETASIMREGFILVKLSSGACTANSIQFTDPNGLFTGDGVGATAGLVTTNVTAMEHGTAGDIVKMRIDIRQD